MRQHEIEITAWALHQQHRTGEGMSNYAMKCSGDEMHAKEGLHLLPCATGNTQQVQVPRAAATAEHHANPNTPKPPTTQRPHLLNLTTVAAANAHSHTEAPAGAAGASREAESPEPQTVTILQQQGTHGNGPGHLCTSVLGQKDPTPNKPPTCSTREHAGKGACSHKKKIKLQCAQIRRNSTTISCVGQDR